MAATAPAQYPLSNVRDPFAPLTYQQQHTLITPAQPWSDQYALTIARDSIEYMERFLQSAGHYSRWLMADQQFVAWRQQQTWEGSRKPKANIPVFLLFSQLESLMPQVLSAMFPLHENVDVAPRPGATIDQAKAAWELIMAQLDSLGEDGLKRFRVIANQAFYQGFLYGNGVIEVSWLFKMLKRLVAEVSHVQGTIRSFDAITQQYITHADGIPKRHVTERVKDIRLNQPDIRAWDIRDFLIDPNCQTPFVQEARFCATLQRVTIQELTSYRGQPGFMIPSDIELIHMAENRYQGMSEQRKRESSSVQGRPWNITDEFTSDPMQKTLELARWFSRERNVWLLNREWCFFNWANTYEVLPFLNAFYVPFPNRWHGMSLADVTEGDQHLQSSLLEARVNELSLAMSAPFIRKNGTMLGNPGTIPMSPSKVIDVNDDVEKAIKRLDVQAQTQQVFMEVNDSERRTAKTTGLSDMAVMGTATAGGNSAQRTAAGVDALKTAAGTRIMYLIENAEASLIEPLCILMHRFNIKFLPRNEMIEILGVDGKQKRIDPADVINALPRFTMRAAARMRQRQQIQQILPWFVQTLMNPEAIQMAQTQNLELDFPLLVDWIMDTINAPKIKLFRPSTQQEIQQRQTPPPEAQLEMQKLQTRLAAAAQMAREKGDTELLNTILGKVITPRAAEDFMGHSDPAHIAAHSAAIQGATKAALLLRPPTLQRMDLPPTGGAPALPAEAEAGGGDMPGAAAGAGGSLE